MIRPISIDSYLGVQVFDSIEKSIGTTDGLFELCYFESVCAFPSCSVDPRKRLLILKFSSATRTESLINAYVWTMQTSNSDSMKFSSPVT